MFDKEFEAKVNSTVAKNLKHFLEINDMTQSDLAKLMGVTTATASNWCKGIKLPRMDKVDKICSIFNINRSDLIEERKPHTSMGSKLSATPHEIDMVEKYRTLDPYGKDAVDSILKIEYDRCQLKEDALTYTAGSSREIGYYQRLASAGTGQVIFDGVPVDRIRIPDIPKYKRVAYAVGVNGSSMEPLYSDNDILLVEPAVQIEVGEIGIFIVEGEAYVKKLGQGTLISLNADYGDIPLTESSRCMGRVVDKFNP